MALTAGMKLGGKWTAYIYGTQLGQLYRTDSLK